MSNDFVELTGDGILFVHPDVAQPTLEDGWMAIEPKYIVWRDGTATLDVRRMIGDLKVAA